MRTLVVLGGNCNKNWLESYMENNKFDYIIAVDKGLEYADWLSLNVNYIIGDFDSVGKNILLKYENSNVVIEKFMPEKDYTDGELAIDRAIDLLSTKIVIVAATGSRLDHVIANIGLLKKIIDNDIDCMIVDSNNVISMIKRTKCIHDFELIGRYISIIAFSDVVDGITLTGFKYPLNNYRLEKGKAIGISNELISDIATISIKSGYLLVINSRD